MPDSLPKKRGVILVRVSGFDQQKTGYSMPSQIRRVREKMKNDGVEEVHEPIEDVESGRNPNSERKGLKTLMNLACNRFIDYVYVYDLDRLGRHYAETPYLMYTLKEYSVVTRDIKEEYNFDDPIQYVWVVIKCYQAHSESLKIAERTQRGKNEKFTQGKWVGPVPFGYRKNSADALEKVSEMEPIILDIFTTYRTLRDIKKTTPAINEKYQNRIGRRSTNQIKTILSNPVYIGRPKYGKTQIDAPQLMVVPADLFSNVQTLQESKAIRHKAKKHRKPESIIDTIASKYGLDYVLRVVKELRPVCPKCGSIMRHNGSKLLEQLNVKIPNFQCTNAKCDHQRTIPSEKELKHLLGNHISCPICGSVDDYNKTVALDGSIKYECRRCGTLFQFTPNKKAEKANEKWSSQERNYCTYEQHAIAKLADPRKQPQNTDKTGLQKALELALSAGFQFSKEAFECLSEISATRDPLKIIDDVIRRLGELPIRPFFIEKKHLEL
jgi:DNA invertase Pin-like site-specific DNA recombinase